MITFTRRLAMLGPVLLALAAAPGCVTTPTVKVHHAEVYGIGAYGVNTLIYLQVRNDNSYDVQVRNLRAQVTLGGKYPLAPVNVSPNQWLPAHQTTLVAVPMSIPWQVLPSLIAETVGHYAIPYYIRGTADVTATRTFGIEKDNWVVDEGGSVPRQVVIDSAKSSIPLAF